MKITQIKQQLKSSERVSIFVDAKYCFSLTLDELLSEKLKKDDELSDSQVEALKKLSGEGKIRARALEWLMGRPHSEKEFRDYLYRKKAEKELIDSLVLEFTQKGYLNNENFGRWFTELRLRKNKSMREVRSELSSKGLSPATIQSIVSEFEATDAEAIKKLLNKLSKRSRYQDPKKLIAYLISKGFRYDDVKQAMSLGDVEVLETNNYS